VIYKWALWTMGLFGIFSICVYVTCGIIRLALFNLKTDKKFFEGLPIPIASLSLTFLMLIGEKKIIFFLSPENPVLISLITIFIGILMISKIKYYHFKHIKNHYFLIILLTFLLLIFLLFFFFKLNIGSIMMSLLLLYLFIRIITTSIYFL
jgi:CDP-diacylglycerol--serine O-phosphatidyltransferase